MGKVAEYMLLDAELLLCSLNTEIHGLFFVPITFTINLNKHYNINQKDEDT